MRLMSMFVSFACSDMFVQGNRQKAGVKFHMVNMSPEKFPAEVFSGHGKNVKKFYPKFTLKVFGHTLLYFS